MADPIFARQRQIVGSTADWLANDLMLGAGELALERAADGAVRAKLGDGFKLFSEAPYLEGSVPALVQGRSRVDYGTVSSVRLWLPQSLVMGGFSIWGNYRNPTGRRVATNANGATNLGWPSGLVYETAIKPFNWYSAFAYIDDAGDRQVGAVPYFTVASVAGLVVSFGLGGEGENPATANSYTGLAVDALAGREVLLVEEARQFSRRVVTATANTAGSITLDDVGGLALGDRLLVAPAAEYAWLGDWLVEAAGEPRNLADTGRHVGSLMSVNIAGVPATGAVETPLEIDCRSYLSPLAGSVSLYRAATLSTTSEGNYAEYWWHDMSAHEVATRFIAKRGTGALTISEGPILVPFSRTQSFVFSDAGLGATVVSRSMQVRGWDLA